MNKREQNPKEKQEDVILNKVLVWIAGAVVLEFLVLLLNRFYVSYTVDMIPVVEKIHMALPVLAVLFLVLFVAGVAVTMSRKKNGKSVGLTAALSVGMLILAACCAVARLFQGTGVKFLYIAVPVVAVLALVYYLYQREFFAIGVLSVLGLLAVWMVRRVQSHGVLVCGYMVILAVLLVLAALLAHKLQAGQGVLTVKGKAVQFLPKNASYAMLYVTCGLVAAVAVAALLLGSLVLLYGVLVAWLLIMAVYYTVRLM